MQNDLILRGVRFLTYILTFIILFGAIKPGLDAMSNTSDLQCCTSSSCVPASELPITDAGDNQNSEQENSCSPGHTCACCLFICSAVATHSFVNEAIPTELYFGYEILYTSNYTSDFWQPPKFV